MSKCWKSLVLACLLCSLFCVYGCGKKDTAQPVTPAPAGMAESAEEAKNAGETGTVASQPAVATPIAAVSEAVDAAHNVVKAASEAISEVIESATH